MDQVGYKKIGLKAGTIRRSREPFLTPTLIWKQGLRLKSPSCQDLKLSLPTPLFLCLFASGRFKTRRCEWTSFVAIWTGSIPRVTVTLILFSFSLIRASTPTTSLLYFLALNVVANHRRRTCQVLGQEASSSRQRGTKPRQGP